MDRDRGGQEARECARNVVAFAVLLVCLLCVLAFLAGCNTVEAVEQLPPGYWVATERLVLAFIEDLWSLISLLL